MGTATSKGLFCCLTSYPKKYRDTNRYKENYHA